MESTNPLRRSSPRWTLQSRLKKHELHELLAPHQATGLREFARLGERVELVRLAEVASGVLFFVAVLRTGWLSDDAFITIRSVDHLLSGAGWGINPGVRVQAFTSPLWALLCIPFFGVTDDPYAALMLPCLVCSLGLIILVCRALRPFLWLAPLVLLVVSASSSFLSFCTSGLENPLAHLLAASVCLERIRRGNRPTRALYWLSAGLFLTRFDLALFVLPTLLLCFITNFRQALRWSLAPLGVAFAWLGFATFYYGFPYPNTAYAKLNVDLSLASRFGGGLEYLLDSASRDPIVLAAILCSSVLVLQQKVPWSVRLLQVGALFYVSYLLVIGGDFMSGRFLTLPFVVSVLIGLHLLSASLVASAHRGFAVLTVAIGVLVGASLEGRAPQHRTDCQVPITGIVDERACYVEHTGLAENVKSEKWKSHVYLEKFRKFLKEPQNARQNVVAFNLVGMAGYATQRPVHIVEQFALSDPLLARIRIEPEKNWRAGHFARPLPEGYLKSLRTRRNHLKDACLRDLYEDLQRVTRGSLWSKERFEAILRLNTTETGCAI